MVGSDGKSVLNGTSNPAATDGAEGDFWINTSNNIIFGPKTANGWPTNGTNLVGSDGKSVLNGTSNPAATDGAEGDFWINTSNNIIFGPKTANGWPTNGTSLIGPVTQGTVDGQILVWNNTDELWEAKANTANSSNIWIKPGTPFQTNDAVTENKDGNIGIGLIIDPSNLPSAYQPDTYAPAEKLEVNGNIRINNIGSSSTTTENSYLEIINDDISTSTFSGINLTNNTSNLATDISEADNMFQIVHEKNSNGTIDPNSSENPQNEFKIRRDLNYFDNNSPPNYIDYITIEPQHTEIGIMTNNPHATLSVGGNSTGNGSANVAIGQNYAVYSPGSPDNETLDQIPNNSLIVEGKIGVGTMDPQSKWM